jgi:hypothetical protein
LARLGWAGTRLRGYQNPNWQFDLLDSAETVPSEELTHQGLFGDSQAIGSSVHLDFAVAPNCLDRFFYPEPVQPLQPVV